MLVFDDAATRPRSHPVSGLRDASAATPTLLRGRCALSLRRRGFRPRLHCCALRIIEPCGFPASDAAHAARHGQRRATVTLWHVSVLRRYAPVVAHRMQIAVNTPSCARIRAPGVRCTPGSPFLIPPQPRQPLLSGDLWGDTKSKRAERLVSCCVLKPHPPPPPVRAGRAESKRKDQF